MDTTLTVVLAFILIITVINFIFSILNSFRQGNDYHNIMSMLYKIELSQYDNEESSELK